MNRNMPMTVTAIALVFLAAATTSCGHSGPRLPDLPAQQDRWASSFALDADSKLQLIGKTKHLGITDFTPIKTLDRRGTINVGDEIEGVSVSAIRCSFFSQDESYGGEQYMWRGRWGCKAGRTKEELENSAGPDGEKRFAYLYAAPVSLPE